MVFTTKLRPSEIRFMQDSIKGRFRKGGAVNDAISEMKNGVLRPEDFPSINVIRLDDKYYSFDNRRLYVFRVAEYEGYISEVPVIIVPEGSVVRRYRFTTNNDGILVFVRQGRTHEHYKKSWFTKPDDRGNRNIPATARQTNQIPLPISAPKESYPTPTTPNQTNQMPKLYSSPELSYLKPKLSFTKMSVEGIKNLNFELISDNTDAESIGAPTTKRQTYQIPEPKLPQQSNLTPTTPRQTYQMALPHSTLEPSYLKPKIGVIKKPAKAIENSNLDKIFDNSDIDYIAVPPRRPNSVNNSYISVKSSTNNSIINHTTVLQPETIPDVEPDQKPGLFRRFLNCCCCCRKFNSIS